MRDKTRKLQVGNALGQAAESIKVFLAVGAAYHTKAVLRQSLRKFDKATAFMESQLISPDFGKNYAFDYEAMLRRYLALVIRVENAPKRAVKQLNKILERKDLPKSIAEQADSWRNALKKWNKEKWYRFTGI